MTARLLIFTPTYDDMLQPDTTASVEAQEFDGEFTWEIDRSNPNPGRNMHDVCVKYQTGRQMALDGEYDALLCVEHDMILSPGCIQTLWDTDAPVVYAAYMLRHGTRVINLFRKEGVKNIGMSLSLYPAELRKAKRLGSLEVSGAGFGCTLMRREALEQAPFRVLAENPPDLAFAGDCLRAGIRQIGRLDVACLHIDTDTGDVLSIEDAHGVVARVLALQDVNVFVEDKTMPLKRDRYYSMPVEKAVELQRAGYVRISNGADERETAVAAEYEVSEPPKVKRRRPKREPRAVSGDTD